MEDKDSLPVPHLSQHSDVEKGESDVLTPVTTKDAGVPSVAAHAHLLDERRVSVIAPTHVPDNRLRLERTMSISPFTGPTRTQPQVRLPAEFRTLRYARAPPRTPLHRS